MEKRKEQPNSLEPLLLSLGTREQLSDEEYLRIGALLERSRFHHAGRDLVLVSPVGVPRPRLKFRRTPLGMLPATVLGALGLEDLLADRILSNARPRCDSCGALAERGDKIVSSGWPRDGYVAVVVDRMTEEISLEEQCELLGAERAIVDGRLARVDDIGGRSGEPVLNLAEVSRAAEIAHEIESWFARGGGAVRLVHFASRDAAGVDIQRVFKGWRCVPCGAPFPVATRRTIEEASPCPQCRGEGWLAVDEERFVACEECDAYGAVTSIRSREFAGVKLHQLAARSIGEIVKALPEEERRQFSRLLTSPLAEYPFGAAVELSSQGERARFSIASAEISNVSGLSLVLDLPSLGGAAEDFQTIVPADSGVAVSVFSPEPPTLGVIKGSGADEEVLTVRDITIGPLSISSLSIPRSEVTLIQGATGSGKTLLLLELARRFAKRRKLAHLAAFGDLKRCHLIRPTGDGTRSVGDLLGIGGDVASEMSRLRTAQERGLREDDFSLSRSKYLCADCSGVPRAPEEACETCQGSLFDGRVGSVKIGDRTFAEIMLLPLSELGKIFWAHDAIAGLVERLPESIRDLSLSTVAASIPPGGRRFLEVFSPIAKGLARKGELASELFLVDAPCATSGAYQKRIFAALGELVGRGATIVCAGGPKDLENAVCSVIRLRPAAEGAKDMGEGRYFDRRVARRSEMAAVDQRTRRLGE